MNASAQTLLTRGDANIMSWSTILNPTTPARTRSRGFTLIELMMVVAIIGIMSAIAIGAYTKNIRKARKTQVIANLSKLALREAAVFSLQGHYASTTQSEGVDSLYPRSTAFNAACGAGSGVCDTPQWLPGDEGYTQSASSGPYFIGGGNLHGFDQLFRSSFQGFLRPTPILVDGNFPEEAIRDGRSVHTCAHTRKAVCTHLLYTRTYIMHQ